MRRSALKVLCLILILLPAPCLALNSPETVPRWEVDGYVLECRNDIFEIVKGDTLESASARTYNRLNREFSRQVDRNFYAYPTWTVSTVL